MKKFLSVLLSYVVIIGVFLYLYQYREQSMAEALRIEDVDKIYLFAEDEHDYAFEPIKADKATVSKLNQFFNQYKVQLTNQQGWNSSDERVKEQFHLHLVYKDSDYGINIVERDVLVTDRVYKIVNAPIDYQWIADFEKDFILSNERGQPIDHTTNP